MDEPIFGEASYFPTHGDPHRCFHQCSPSSIAKALDTEVSSPERIKLIVDDIFNYEPSKFHHRNYGTPWEGEESLDSIGFVILENHNLPRYAIESIAPHLYKRLLASSFSSIFFSIWRKMILQPQFSQESLIAQIFQIEFYMRQQLEKVFNVIQAVMLNAIMEHPNMGPEGFMQLCSSENIVVRYLASRHLNCPKSAKVAATLIGTTVEDYRKTIGV